MGAKMQPSFGRSGPCPRFKHIIMMALSLAGLLIQAGPGMAATGDPLITGKTPCGFCVVIDGGGSEIADATEIQVVVPFAMTITGYTALADVSGSISIDVWKDTYANAPPTDADTITASAPIAISSAVKSQDTTLTGWTTSVSAGDVLIFHVDSCTSIERVSISIGGTR